MESPFRRSIASNPFSFTQVLKLSYLNVFLIYNLNCEIYGDRLSEWAYSAFIRIINDF